MIIVGGMHNNVIQVGTLYRPVGAKAFGPENLLGRSK